MTPSPDPRDELRLRDSAADPLVADSQSLEDKASKYKDRSAIGRRVVSVFLAVVIFMLLYVLLGPIVYGWEIIKTPAEYATTIIGSVLLPVVTLVLGYYFGTGD